MGTDETTALIDERSPARLGESQRANSDKPVIEIVGGPGRLTLSGLLELWQYRGVLVAFTIRTVKVRYKQAAIGVGWAVLQPVIAAAIFAAFLGRISGIDHEGVPYLVFALAGMVAWTYFSGATMNGSDSLVANESMLRKLYFPREILPLSAILAALVDLLPALGVLALVVVLSGISPELTWLALPVPIALLIVFAAAVSAFTSAVNVYYRDVKYALPFVIQLGLFASPVVYSLDTIPEEWRSPYAILNPVAAGIDGLRRAMLHGDWPDWTLTLGALAWALILLVVGYAVFKRLERGFSDRV